MQLSKLEHQVYETLRKNNLLVFKAKDISVLLNFDKTKTYNIIKSLKKKKAIETIRNGRFSLKEASEFVVGANLNWPSYLSFWSALNYYGFSDQTPKKIFFASTKYKKNVRNFRFVTLSKKRFFGYTSIGEIVIAEKEKALIDSILLPKYSGGMQEIFISLKNSLREINAKKLVGYAIQINSKAVIRRLGFLLEKLGEKKHLKQLLENKGKGFELLDPSLKRKNFFNKKWLMDINW